MRDHWLGMIQPGSSVSGIEIQLVNPMDARHFIHGMPVFAMVASDGGWIRDGWAPLVAIDIVEGRLRADKPWNQCITGLCAGDVLVGMWLRTDRRK